MIGLVGGWRNKLTEVAVIGDCLGRLNVQGGGLALPYTIILQTGFSTASELGFGLRLALGRNQKSRTGQIHLYWHQSN